MKHRKYNAIMFVLLSLMAFAIGFELSKVVSEPTYFVIDSAIQQSTGWSHDAQRWALHLSDVAKSPVGKIGFLTSRELADSLIMPLFGERAPFRRHRYNYYTVNDPRNSLSEVKLPVYHNERDCTDEVACDEIYSGDIVRVHGYDSAFTVVIY